MLDFADAATMAQLESASALVLAADDDAGNVDLALWARRAQPDLPLVVRMFDEALAGYLAGTVDHLTILSMSRVAAPVFADAALRDARRSRGSAGAAGQRHGPRSGPTLDRVLWRRSGTRRWS